MSGRDSGFGERAPAQNAGDARAADWTSDGTYANSSEEYLAISAAVAALIRDSAHSLILGGSENVGRLIVAQLAHVHGLAPANEVSAPRSGANRKDGGVR